MTGKGGCPCQQPPASAGSSDYRVSSPGLLELMRTRLHSQNTPPWGLLFQKRKKSHLLSPSDHVRTWDPRTKFVFDPHQGAIAMSFFFIALFLCNVSFMPGRGARWKGKLFMTEQVHHKQQCKRPAPCLPHTQTAPSPTWKDRLLAGDDGPISMLIEPGNICLRTTSE